MKYGEYALSPSSSRADILDVLQKLVKDARQAAMEAAYANFVCPDADKAREAAEFEGMRKILNSLEWAFGGTAENEGCDPKVGITS